MNINIKPIEIVAGLIFDNKKVLVAKTKNGEWEFPGGKINESEKYEDAIMREIKEELNLSVEVIEEIGSIEIDIDEKTIQLFTFILVKGSINGIQLNIHSEYKLVNYDELKTLNLSKADKLFIDLYKDKINNLF